MSDHPTLRFGDTGAEVADLQALLNDILGSVKVDGTFGSGTLQAVKTFQTSQKLTSDGIVGPKTWAALDKARENIPKGKDSEIPDQFMVKISKTDFAALKASYASIANILKKYE